MVLIAAVLWGSNGIFVKLLASSGLNSLERSSIRLIIAAILETIIVYLSDRKSFNIEKKDLFSAALIGIIGIFGFLCSYNQSINLVGMATAGVLIYLMPSIVMIYSCIFNGQKLTAKKILVLVLNLIGCGLVSGILSDQSGNILGIVIGLFAAFCYAFNNIGVATALKKYSPLTKMYYPALFAGICGLLYLLIGSDITKIGTILISNPKLILICLVWTICCSILTYYLFNSALSYLDVSRASLLSTFEPVAAVIFGVVLFHEQIDVFGIIGIIMVFVSLVLNEL